MKISEIIKTKSQITRGGFHIEEDVLTNIDINTIAHFGNLTSLQLNTPHGNILSTRQTTSNLGLLIRAFVILMCLESEDGIRLSSIRNIPISIVFDGTNASNTTGTYVGFGSSVTNRFVSVDEFVSINDW